MLELLGNQDESLALLSVQTRVGPSFCNNMEMVKRNKLSVQKMRAAFTDAVGGALGVPHRVWDDGPEVGKDPLLAETVLTPWDIQVRAQGVRLAGKLGQAPAPSANRPLNGELGKALACAKRDGAERSKKNTLLDAAREPMAAS